MLSPKVNRAIYRHEANNPYSFFINRLRKTTPNKRKHNQNSRRQLRYY